MFNTHKKHWHGALLTTAAVAVAIPSTPAMAGEDVTLSYYLTRTTLSAAVSQRLVACPTTDGRIDIQTIWTLAATPRSDYAQEVRLDASSGFLTRRSVELNFAANGTLSGINATSEGQGQAVVASIVGLASKIVPAFFGVPGLGAAGGFVERDSPRDTSRSADPYCTREAIELLTSLRSTRATITELQAVIASGDATPQQTALLATMVTREEALIGQLTVDVGQARFAPEATPGSPLSGNAYVPRPDNSLYAHWLREPDQIGNLTGQANGYRVTWLVDARDYQAMHNLVRTSPADARVIASVLPAGASRRYYYRVPVGVSLLAEPCRTGNDVNCVADETTAGAAATAAMRATLPQFGALRSVPIGSAGIFASRSLRATLDANGRPLTLAYTRDPGAAGVAAAIDGAGTVFSAARSAELDNLTRAADIEEARARLRELRTPDDE